LFQPWNSFTKNADYGIYGASAHWFKTYLTTRKQKVNISLQIQRGEFSSSWETTGSGIPLGTILEQSLFIMYIHDLPYGINSYANPAIYSDDTTMLTLRRLMSYIYGAPILDVSRSHTTTQHSR